MRYIAVNDGVDTASGFNDMTSIKNLLNDFYARDISRKIRSSRQARAKAGLYLSNLPLFGYLKDPDDHHKLIVDEKTAPTVLLIFRLAAQGKGTNGITRYLTAHQIPCPGWWLKLIRKYADLRELTPEILNELISKILVYQREETPDGAKQVVEIHYRLIGKAGDDITRCL